MLSTAVWAEFRKHKQSMKLISKRSLVVKGSHQFSDDSFFELILRQCKDPVSSFKEGVCEPSPGTASGWYGLRLAWLS